MHTLYESDPFLWLVWAQGGISLCITITRQKILSGTKIRKRNIRKCALARAQSRKVSMAELDFGGRYYSVVCVSRLSYLIR